MLAQVYRRARAYFSVPSAHEEPDIIAAQYEVFSRQIPLMYSVLLINAWILVSTFFGDAPWWLTVLCPVVFTLISFKRLVGWWRGRGSQPSVEVARKNLIGTNRVALAMALFLVAWSISLYHYGNVAQQSHIAFFMAVTGVCVVICLMHLRSAAFIVWLVICSGFFVHYLSAEEASFVAMAINMPFVTMAVLLMVHVQANHFSNSVAARSRMEAVSHENLRLANTDNLTGLPNRRMFFAELGRAMRTAPEANKRVAAAVIDMDGFKSVNDLYGHAAGDEVLIEVGQRLRRVAKDKVLVSRLGGDEFAILVEDESSDAALLRLGKEMCAKLSAPFDLGDTTVTLSASIGFAVHPDVAQCPRTLYERADYAHYDCKRHRRGTAALFSKEQISEIKSSKRIETVLRSADHAMEIFPYFQPIVDVSSGRLIAFEALSRWESPELGCVAPGSFIGIAERIGLIGAITHISLKKALEAVENWPEDICLSFNLSAHEISSSDALGQIMAIVRESPIDPRRIDFEITETAVMADMMRAETSVRALRKMGCGVALDDFGTGYSSLTQLHSLALTKIKVDRSFITKIESTTASFKIVKSLLTLSKDMGLSCVVEGVESEVERAVVEQLGGTLIQGYYFSKPLTEPAALEFLQDYNFGSRELVA